MKRLLYYKDDLLLLCAEPIQWGQSRGEESRYDCVEGEVVRRNRQTRDLVCGWN